MELILEYLHNYFYRFKEKGKFKIEFNNISRIDGELKGQYVDGQYIKIVGSAVNDGIYKVIATESDELAGMAIEGCLKDEIFEGYICSLSIPKPVVELNTKVQEYLSKQEPSNIVSESFGGYSYTKGTINGKVLGWQDVFYSDLRPYRRMTDGFKFVKEVK